jgi:hypothetical protein
VTTIPLPAVGTRQRGASRTPGRTLFSYLLVPRPKDLVKAVVLPITFVLAAVARQGESISDVGKALLVWVALELLVYQARYQWNDVRGFEADQAHPQSASRGRLPGPVDKARSRKATSLAVAALRLALTGLLALAVPDLARLLGVMTVAVFGVAWCYERLRSSATGRTSSVPVPVRPPLVALWVAVGAGYAVRALTGLALVVDLTSEVGLAIVTGVAAWSLGVVFVTCRWTLEAMCFGSVEGSRMTWQVRPDQAREHTLGLVRWLPEDASPALATGPCGWRALQGRTPLTAPWHLALVCAGASAAPAGALLAGRPSTALCLLAAVVGGTGALAVAALPGRRLLTAAGAALVLGLVLNAAGLDRPAIAVLPWVASLALYGCFTRQCADEVGEPLRRLAPLLSR